MRIVSVSQVDPNKKATTPATPAPEQVAQPELPIEAPEETQAESVPTDIDGLLDSVAFPEDAAFESEPAAVEEEEDVTLPEVEEEQKFDIEFFRNLKNYVERQSYCEKYLQKVGVTKSRIIYAFDEHGILKLAKTPKGIHDNLLESDPEGQREFDVVPRVVDVNHASTWLIQERGKKITSSVFRTQLGIDVRDFAAYVGEYSGSKFFAGSVTESLRVFCEESQYIQQMVQLSKSWHITPPSLCRLESWGLVVRDGHEILIYTGDVAEY